MNHSKIIEELSLDLQPTRRLTPVGKRFAQWLFLSLVWSAIFLSVHGLRSDIYDVIVRPTFVLEVLLPFTLSLITALFALQLRAPAPLGRARPYFVRWGLFFWIAAVALHTWQTGEQKAFLFSRDGTCFAIVALLSTGPGYILYRHLREGAPTSPQTCAFFAAVATGLLSTGVATLGCSVDGAIHLFVGHVLPVGIFVVLIYQAARRLLSW